MDFLLPAIAKGGYRDDNYWVWGGSVIKGEDNRYHLFVSRWPRNLNFLFSVYTNSEIIRCSADHPHGPFIFQEVALPPRGPEFWDGRMTHNPTVHKCRDTYLLFYIGNTYQGPTPSADNPLDTFAWETKKTGYETVGGGTIGVATSKSIFGPWKRSEKPLIIYDSAGNPIQGNNPAPAVHEDGSVLLVLKQAQWIGQHRMINLKAARADHYLGPYQLVDDDFLFDYTTLSDAGLEDPYIWKSKKGYEMVVKDMGSRVSGQRHGGLHAVSEDGRKWRFSDPPNAYSRTLKWDDGSITEQGMLERPQVLVENGIPTHIYFATGDGQGLHNQMTWSANIVVPLRKPC